MKTEFHCHTNRSFDCEITIEERLKTYRSLNFEKLYITDHDRNTLNAWCKLSDSSLKVCKGIELSTYYGHVIVLDTMYMPPFSSLWAIVLWSKISGGKIYIPHPCRPGTGFFKRCEERRPATSYVTWFLSNVDFIEVWNPRDKDGKRVRIPRSWLQKLGITKYTIASDSHFSDDIWEAGCASTGLESGSEFIDNFFDKKFEVSTSYKFSYFHFLRSGLYGVAYLFGYRPR